jgi:hypothetical protein
MAGWWQRHEHEHAVDRWRAEEQTWETEQGRLRELVDTARTFAGVGRGEDTRIPIELHGDERVFYVAEGVALIEPRRLPSHWEGGYSGFSFRIARGVRWHVGGTRGHSVPGAEVPTPIDTGTATITDQRVVFQGDKQAREWAYAKLIGYHHDPAAPWTAIQVSNREKVSGILYDHAHADEFHFRLALALAHYHHDVEGFVHQLEAEVASHAQNEPRPPPPVAI